MKTYGATKKTTCICNDKTCSSNLITKKDHRALRGAARNAAKALIRNTLNNLRD